MFNRMSPQIRFRARFLSFEGVIGGLIVLTSSFVVVPWWSLCALVMVIGVFSIVLLSQYGQEETRFIRMGVDIETGDVDTSWMDEDNIA